jgi:hypothetical protein
MSSQIMKDTSEYKEVNILNLDLIELKIPSKYITFVIGKSECVFMF